MHLDRAVDEQRRAVGQRPVAGRVEDLLGVVLDSGHVGLVERVDAEDPAGDRGGVLPEPGTARRADPLTRGAPSPAGPAPAPSDDAVARPRRRRRPGGGRRPRRRPAGCPCPPCRSTRRSAARPSRRSRRCRSRRRRATTLSRPAVPRPRRAPRRARAPGCRRRRRGSAASASASVEQLGRRRRRPARLGTSPNAVSAL